MGRRLVKQDNGLFAIWSSIVDAVILYNATAEQIVEFCVEEVAKREREEAELWVRGERSGSRVWTPAEVLAEEEAIIRDMKRDGEDASNRQQRLDENRRRLAGEVLEQDRAER